MQLSSLKSITKDNVIFEDAVTNQHDHERINIKVNVFNAGTAGENIAKPLVIASPFRFSFGVQPSLSKRGDVVGYTLPTPLWNGSGEPTQKEFAFYEALKELKHICYQYLDEVYGIDMAESIKFPLVEKEGKAPVLYPKLMYSQKSEEVFSTEVAETMKFPMSEDCFLHPKLMYNKDTKEIRTPFYTRGEDEEEEKVEDPLFYLGKRCRVKMAIVIDCILVEETDNEADDVALVQLKVHDVYVEPPLDRVNRLTYLSDDEEEYGVEATETYWKTPPSWMTTLDGWRQALVNNQIFPGTSAGADSDCEVRVTDGNKMVKASEKIFNDIPLLSSRNPQEIKEKLKMLTATREAGNTSIGIRNGIIEIIDYLLRENEISKKQYNAYIQRYLKV
ncbi:hypothetical protein AWC38_SpisGene4287 [Stylophora pistillata]|uniref:Uncharacterized protein n=1 Tax=Stylophora pistillata TaxID=50429 RepID=A0A2B4SQX7_STYPI|nr:hypothetical protein AWC38_SpisGene4287 [Stylophora pistillata]